MGMLSLVTPIEPTASAQLMKTMTKRADILDRNGSVLATNLITNALYAKPNLMFNKENSIQKLVKIFPDLDIANLKKLFASGRKFI